MSPPESIASAARQHLETCLLFGVDIAPIAREAKAQAATVAAGESENPGAIFGAPRQDRSQAEALNDLRLLHERECPLCTKAQGITNIVFGEGNPEADLMFIGEAPGEQEDLTGRPFVGRAGQKLDEIIKAMGFARGDIYIANVLKTRPPDNRTPLPDEVDRCGPYLVEQIRIIQPGVIVTLGGPASKLLLEAREGITRLRGTWAIFNDGTREIPVMPTFHPAYLLRNYTHDTRSKIWSDMQAVVSRLRGG